MNEFDEWTGEDAMTEGRLLPPLQDDPDVLAALQWGAVRRDLFVLDDGNEVVRVYHLDELDPSDAGNCAALRQLRLDLAP